MEKEDRVNAVGNIITGIAKRNTHKFRNRTTEDLSQELWVKVLERETSAGHDLDLDLIAKICYDTVVDIQRYDEVRNCLYLDNLVEDNINLYSTYPSDDLNKILLNDLLNAFPKDSKEYYFLTYWYTASGYKDFFIEGSGKTKGGYTESDLATKLGYSGTSSGGFKRFRSKIREFIIKFMQE